MLAIACAGPAAAETVREGQWRQAVKDREEAGWSKGPPAPRYWGNLGLPVRQGPSEAELAERKEREELRLAERRQRLAELEAERAAERRAEAQARQRSEIERAGWQGHVLMVESEPGSPEFLRGLAMAQRAVDAGDLSATVYLAKDLLDPGYYRPKDARRLMQAAADRGDASALRNLAQLAFAGIGGPRDLELAARCSVQAVRRGKPADEPLYAAIPRDGKGEPLYDAESLTAWCRALSKQGYTHATFNLADRHAAGAGTKVSIVNAMNLWAFIARTAPDPLRTEALDRLEAGLDPLFAAKVMHADVVESACLELCQRRDSPAALYRLGLLVLALVVEHPDPQAGGRAMIAKAREQGHAGARGFDLDGREPDERLARCAWLSARAHAGDAAAMASFGEACIDADGRPADVALGMRWSAKAAAAGESIGETMLEVCIERLDQQFSTEDARVAALGGAAEAGSLRCARELLRRSRAREPADPAAVARWLTVAGVLGDEPSRRELVAQYPVVDLPVVFGDVPDAEALALRWTRIVAEQGSVDAAGRLALWYRIGYGCERDLAESVRWWRTALERGDRNAVLSLVSTQREAWLESGRTGADADGILERLLGLLDDADRGFVRPAIDQLVEAHCQDGLRLDLAQARRLAVAVEALPQPDLMLFHDIARVFDRQGPVPALDGEAAIAWHRRAAELGHYDSKFRLAMAHELGEFGVPKDPVRAWELTIGAAASGNDAACLIVARRYEAGEGVAADGFMALSFFRQAADHGHAEAQFEVGRCLERGIGAAADREGAKEYYRKAAAQGHAGAKERVTALEP